MHATLGLTADSWLVFHALMGNRVICEELLVFVFLSLHCAPELTLTCFLQWLVTIALCLQVKSNTTSQAPKRHWDAFPPVLILLNRRPHAARLPKLLLPPPHLAVVHRDRSRKNKNTNVVNAGLKSIIT